MTGLLYLMVIIMWAVVLVPIGLKNYDRKQIEQQLRQVGELPVKWHWAARKPKDERTMAFVRRRRVLMTLLTVLIATSLMALSGQISPAFVLLPLTLLFLFLSAAIRVSKHTIQPRQNLATVVGGDTQPHTAKVAMTDHTQSASPAVDERTWQPVESPIPAYVRAARATPYARNIDANKPWTSNEMLEQLALLREAQIQRQKAAQQRLQQARALSMEQVRKAALGSTAQHQIDHAGNDVSVESADEVAVKRVVNE